MKLALHLAIILSLLSLTWLFGEGALILRESRPKVDVTLSNLDRTIIIAGATASDVQKAAAKWEKASDAQILQSTELLKGGNAAFASLRSLADHTDASLNVTLLPQVQSLLKEQNGALLADEKALQIQLETMQKVTSDIGKVVADPAIKVSLDNLALATHDADATLLQLKALLESGTATAEDVRRVADKFAEQYTKARNIYYAVFKELLGIGSQAVQFSLTK